MMKTQTALLASLALITLTAATPMQTARDRGEEIAKETDRRGSGFEDSVSKVEMVLIDSTGAEARRYLTVKAKEDTADAPGTKSLVVFHEPKDVKGTALLTHMESLKNDQQWLYLPAIKRVKRIPSNNRTGSFVASEFTYEDMLPIEIERYEHTYLDTVRCGEQSCYKLERTALYEGSGYKRQISYIDTEHYRIKRVDFYNARDSHFKTLYFRNFKLYDEKFWRALEMTMVNHETGKTTYLLWDDFAFKNGYSNADFAQTNLTN